jgi:hypothetical protein
LINGNSRAAYDHDNPFDVPNPATVQAIIDRAIAEKDPPGLQGKMEENQLLVRRQVSQRHLQRGAATRERKPGENLVGTQATPEEHARRRARWQIIKDNLDKDALDIMAQIQCFVNLRLASDLNAGEELLIHLAKEVQEQRQEWATKIEGLQDRREDVWAPLWSQQVEQDIRAEYHDRREEGLARKEKAAKDKATRQEAAEKDREYWAARSTGTRGEDEAGRHEQELNYIALPDHGLQRNATLDGDQKQ